MPDEKDARIDPYAWYMLGVMAIVYVLNFVDRQMLTILAPDLKRDLGISDADFGFLYGTAFGVFYALFGIPLGKLADRWSRVRLLTIGLALWSAMTTLSGASRNFAQIAATRVGVGIGEATATPCAYSVISDYFPPRRRATALSIYSAGLYLGSGVSLFLGSRIAGWWNDAFTGGAAPLGLAGWQVAFMAVGLPGLLLAGWVASLREPPRGRFEGVAAGVAEAEPFPFRSFIQDLADIIPPFTLLGAWQRGPLALLYNVMSALVAALAAMAMIHWTGDTVQWLAVALGFYAAFSWITSLRSRDPETFALLLKSRGFMALTLGYALVSFIGYSSSGFAPLQAIEGLGADPASAGLIMGGLGAVGGSLGVIGGGIVADRIARHGDHAGRVLVIAISAFAGMVCHAAMFATTSLPLFYTMAFLNWIFVAATLGGSSGTIVNIVPPKVRGVATATFLLGTNLIGLALGPYTAGKMSTVFGSLAEGMLSILVLVPVMLALFVLAWRDLGKAQMRG